MIDPEAGAALPEDPHRDNGHRTFTHTLVFNVGVGIGIAALCNAFMEGLATIRRRFCLAVARQ